ncbi:MAG: Pup--protein ligase [Actinomycetes bacterium]
MERRIFGIENEYGVTFTLKGQKRLSPDEVARYLFKRVVTWGRSSNLFLENGARLYLDVGSHPEYATPECDLIGDVVTHDKAGEWILSEMVRGAEDELNAEGIRGQIHLFKNNTDSAGNSYGCHENYLTDRDDELSRYSKVLIPFLVSRQIYAGAGKLLKTPKGTTYCLSQRAAHIWEGVSSATTRSRPIINTRDEPHADAELYRRLHVIVGDSNMNEYTNFLKVGATSVLLTMLEDKGQILRDLTLEDPIRAIREISEDITLTATVKLANGREITALDIQTEYLERALRYRDSKGLPPQEDLALTMWAATIAQLKSDPSELWREIDWVAKLRLIEQYQARHDMPSGSAKLEMIDLLYHDVDRSRGLFYKLQATDQARRTTTDQDIATAMTLAPQTTRARLRGAFVKRAAEQRRDYAVDWVHLKLNDQAQRAMMLRDPFRSHDDRVDRLIESL